MHLPLIPGALQPDAVKRRAGTSLGLVSALAAGTKELAPLVLREVPHLLGSVLGGAVSAGAAVLGRRPGPAPDGEAPATPPLRADAPATPPVGAGQGSAIELERDSALPPPVAQTSPAARPSTAAAPTGASPPLSTASAPPLVAPVPASAPARRRKAASPREAAPAAQASLPEVAVEVGAPGAADEAVQEAIADRGAGSGQVPAPAHDELPLPDYDHLTLPALRARIRRLDLEGLLQVRAYEVAHAHRLPVLTTLDNRVAKLRAEPAGS